VTIYVDTSTVLRLVLGEPGALTELRRAERLVSSELLEVESRRTIDRLARAGALSPDEAVDRLASVGIWIEAIDLVLLRAPVLTRAGDPLPNPLGTLDAIHLATALVWRDRFQTPLTFATHDAALGLAARTFLIRVIGC
jgi:predicted nucleic acid-binding protein